MIEYKGKMIKKCLRNGKVWFKVSGKGLLFANIESVKLHIDNK